MAAVPAVELAQSNTPLAIVLGKTMIGAAGSKIVQIGIMVSVLGASLSWIILSVETLYAAAREGVVPKILAKTNKKDTPVNALLVTQIFTQVFLFTILSPALNETYLAAITIGTTMALIPYLLSSLYAVKLAFGDKREKNIHRAIALLGTFYSVYVIYAVGLKYLYLSLLFYAVGVFVYLSGRYEQRKKPKLWEWAFMISLIVGAIAIAALIFTGVVEI